ncbi:MAG: cupin domain-containing protein [Vicinamibacteria bacterium]|nr:cupin domain-containing protein [Vicinamibacteria bacterium]
MPVLNPFDSPTFSLPGVTFTGLASPSRGSLETSLWRVRLAPGTPGLPHRVTREEIFLVTAGTAKATVGDESHRLTEGCTLIVPPNVDFSLANDGLDPFEAIALIPVGGAAIAGDGAPFTPPWAL